MNTEIGVYAFINLVNNTICLPSCRIPDDYIDPKRYPLFMAREVVLELLAQFKAESKVDAKVGT